MVAVTAEYRIISASRLLKCCLYWVVLAIASQAAGQQSVPTRTHRYVAPPEWTTSVFGPDDKQTEALIDRLRIAFSKAKSERQARDVASGFISGDAKTLEPALKTLLANYHLSRLSHRTVEDQRKCLIAWVTFCKRGNPKSPQHAFVACIVSPLVNCAQVSQQTARTVFYRFDRCPEHNSLLYRYYSKLPLEPSQDYLDLIAELERWEASFPKGLVYDRHKDEYNSRASLRANRALFLDIMAENPSHRASKQKATDIIKELLSDPLIHPENRKHLEVLKRMFEKS